MLTSTLWRKAGRDLWLYKGRSLMVVAAISIGVIATGSILTALSIVSREIDRNYGETIPPAVVMTAQRTPYVDDASIAVILENEAVDAVEMRRTVTVRLLTREDEWASARLLVIEDFDDLRVAKFYPESGGWDPGPTEILIERSSLDEVPMAIGDELELQAPGQRPATLTVKGLTHDPGQTPAWMTGQIVGYISLGGLETLGYEPFFDELLVAVDPDHNRSQNYELATELKAELRASLNQAGGEEQLFDTSVPIPGEHPANGVMRTMLFLMQSFGVLSLISGGALVATIISAQIKQQSTQIGVMKALGGSTKQIASIYFASVTALAAIALLVGIPLGILLGRGFVSFTFSLLNFEVGSYTLAWWVLPVQILAALAIPLASIAGPVLITSGKSAHELLASNGANTPNTAMTTAIRRLARARFKLSTTTSFGVRNTLRSPLRSALTALALALGGAAFMVALNTGVAWDHAVNTEFDSRSYDLDVSLDQQYEQTLVQTALEDSSVVESFELWSSSSATIETPDGGPGSAFSFVVGPADTDIIGYPIGKGRWLDPTDRNSIVVSQTLTDPAPEVGAVVTVTISGVESDWTVVGIVRQISGGSGGVAYASNRPGGSEQVRATGNLLRISLTEPLGTIDEDGAGEEAAGDEVAGDILSTLQEELERGQIQVQSIGTAEAGRQSLDDHLVIIVGLLGLMATLVLVVAALGLIESMSINVLERRGEIGVMRAVGASTRTVIGIIAVEGIVLAVASWVLAVLLSIPASAVVQDVAGEMFLGAPLELAISPSGMAAWLALVLLLSIIATAIPALEATEVPVHQALSDF